MAKGDPSSRRVAAERTANKASARSFPIGPELIDPTVLEAKLDQILALSADADQARSALAGIIVDFFDTALAETVTEVGKRLAATFHPHQLRANALITFVRHTASNLLDIPFRAPDSSELLELRHDPFWVTRARTEMLDTIPSSVFDRFLPKPTRQVRLRRRLLEEIDAVLLRNVENLRWATRQNLDMHGEGIEPPTYWV